MSILYLIDRRNSHLSTLSTEPSDQPSLKHRYLLKCSAAHTSIKTALLLSLLTFGVVGCQSQPYNTSSATTTTPVTTTTDPNKVTDTTILFEPSRLPAFNIQGKMGAIIPETDQQARTSASAFYVWAQEDERFSIDLSGALGIGHTVIEYNGQTATLTSESTGTISATSPDALLAQTTGWQAPISQLPYWISGSPTPSDTDTTVDEQHRLLSAVNSEWTAKFDYNDVDSSLPSKLKILRDDGHQITMTITHSEPVASNLTATDSDISQPINTIEASLPHQSLEISDKISDKTVAPIQPTTAIDVDKVVNPTHTVDIP